MEFLSGCQVLAAFSQEAIEIQTGGHCHNSISRKDIAWKTTQPFSKSSNELFLTLWSIYLKVKIPLPENFTSYLLPVTCTSVQFNVMQSSRQLATIPYSGLYSLGTNFPEFPEWTHSLGKFILHVMLYKVWSWVIGGTWHDCNILLILICSIQCRALLSNKTLSLLL